MAKISDTSAYPSIATLDPADYLIITDAENKLMTKTCTIQQLQGEFGIDTKVAHIEVTSAQLLAIHNTPKELISVGTDEVVDLMSVMAYTKVGTTNYNFQDDFQIGNVNPDPVYSFNVFCTWTATYLNVTEDRVWKNRIMNSNSIISSPGNNFVLRTNGSNPATQGDGSLFLNIYYRVLKVGTTF